MPVGELLGSLRAEQWLGLGVALGGLSVVVWGLRALRDAGRPRPERSRLVASGAALWNRFVALGMLCVGATMLLAGIYVAAGIRGL